MWGLFKISLQLHCSYYVHQILRRLELYTDYLLFLWTCQYSLISKNPSFHCRHSFSSKLCNKVQIYFCDFKFPSELFIKGSCNQIIFKQKISLILVGFRGWPENQNSVVKNIEFENCIICDIQFYILRICQADESELKTIYFYIS